MLGTKEDKNKDKKTTKIAYGKPVVLKQKERQININNRAGEI